MRKFSWIGLSIAAFVVAALLAPSPEIMGLNSSISRMLEPLGHRWPFLQLIWVVGGLPLTTLLVIYQASGRWGRQTHEWRLLWGFIGGSIVELILKHYIATPLPINVAAPPPYAQITAWTNIEPATVVAWLGALVPTHGLHHAARSFLRGSFPSGHVFRITYAYGLFLRNWTYGILILIAAFAVVATGGHWPWDTVGGALLGMTSRLVARSKRSGRGESAYE
ncbi:MAG: hypothetical protein C7B44_06860 [Sulfobacillus thermosulfidooxidans]|nr:MAG: hypothetical protein C7B44_06860 [Sulfobacillus thermosulfidooxidans]